MENKTDIGGSLSDKVFFEKIFREYFVALTYYALKLVRDNDTAKDIVHQVFVNIWEKRDSISIDRPLRAYLYTAVHNRSLNYLRDKRRFHDKDAGDIELQNELASPDSDSLETEETEARIAQAVSGLPGRCAEVFRLSRFEEKRYSEIAEILNISVKTVEAQMSKALRILREELKDLLTIIIILIISQLL
ncbi:MAG: RNA polymerase sigma-70 factor [Bacteroidales bacterium]|nr:RNA polymerase sigma-70 factor [Bacteroidales bacterium]